MQDDTCVWPGCRKRPEDARLPICDGHALEVHDHIATRMGDTRTADRSLGRPADADRIGLVYYLLVGDLVKIGFTTNLATRLRTYPPHARLLATEPGVKPLEAQRHRELRHSLTRGREWFAHSDEVRAHIAAVVAEHGEPKVIKPRGMRKPVDRTRHPVTVTRIGA